MEKLLNAAPSLVKPSLVLPRESGRISGPEGLGAWAKWELEILDGSKIVDKREGAAHSFVKNFGKLIRGMFDVRDTVNETLTDSSGVTFQPRIKSGPGITGDAQPVMAGSPGMKFGASAAALNANQINIQGAILVASASTIFTAIAETAVGTTFKCEASVLNTGGSFTVEEIAIFINLRKAAVNVGTEVMMLRDLTGSVIVGAGLTILGRYTFTLNV